jgi:hypothetical protein
MTIKRLILIVLTIIAIYIVSLSLIKSWGQPQIQSRLELYQTNLLLHAAEWQGGNTDGNLAQPSSDLKTARNALIGDEPLKTAQKQYQEARALATTSLDKAEKQLQQLAFQPVPSGVAPKEELPYPPVAEPSSPKQKLQSSINQLEGLIDELDLRLGIIKAEQGETNAALKTWNDLIKPPQNRTSQASSAKTAAVLVGLWSEPQKLLPDAQQQIQKDLDGWFRYRALTKLYQLQQRQDELSKLQADEQAIAQQAVVKLAIVGSIPLFGFIIGVGLLIFLVIQLLIQGKRSLLAHNSDTPWSTPWDAEIIWQVFIVGFFFIGQILLPLFFSVLPINPASFGIRAKAFYVLLSYLLLASGGLLVLYLSIKRFVPLPEGWFRIDWRGRWVFWGLGGYFVALPLVILVSLINQKLWQGQGGSNPILPIALEGRDGVALAVFFLTAAVAAPLFEELLFRGFLLPSLTRYMPVWVAIFASSLLFAIAHLSLSEVLPLMTLGIVLGVVYTRSRNLLASMLLHSLWNSGTLLSLFLLGSGGR